MSDLDDVTNRWAAPFSALPLDKGLGQFGWKFSRRKVLTCGFFEHATHGMRAREPIVVGSATLEAYVHARWKGVSHPSVQLEARIPPEATPFTPLAPSSPWWRDLTTLSAWLGGPPLPLPDGEGSGTLDSGRPYVASGTAKWSLDEIDVRCELMTNRLEHVVRFIVLGPSGYVQKG